MIDRSITASSNDLVVCVLNGDFTLKRIVFGRDHISLVPANRDFPIMRVDASEEFEVWGVVKHVIHSV